ncbi:conidial pigment biosynthesis oxidase Abr1/brown 1 [Ophiocordyceps sinensis CO18]|uniref:Conidial pigment biosynthesis oxidase Abr1/brown 1 n=1 Tax=Ophiocordyceps sinensis (strain Co18 / CGMCC 3.14243) TaxID=911162 RepID=T5AL77_OPHSC|nr:conidial pigment biosynthesis oxidase Abr1/brown 1 [Ophiocordyceps sinensis CO18]
MFKSGILLALLQPSVFVLAKVVHLDWNITWVWTAPDGFYRPMIGINNQWPCPQVDLDLGDRVIVDVHNGLGNESTGIHWHGLHQYMTGVMDGSTQVTQCPLPPGERMRYDFTVHQTGTYWYHSHNMGQYPDGLRGPIVVHDPCTPFEYDEEFVLLTGDHYHEQMPRLLNEYLSLENGERGVEPLPDSLLIGESTSSIYKVKPNKTYLVRWICIGNFAINALIIYDHELTVVETDGVWTDPYPLGPGIGNGTLLRCMPGMRVSVLMRTKADTSRNYPIFSILNPDQFFEYENRTMPDDFKTNATAWLVYDEDKPLSPLPELPNLADENFADDVRFYPADHERIFEPVEHRITLNTGNKTINGVHRFTVNGETYLPPKTPSLYTALTVGPEYVSNPQVYGHVNPLVVRKGQVIEVVINNHHNNFHPWHLHGHNYQVIQRTAINGGDFAGYFANVSWTPMKRDTVVVQNNGHVVIRFRADNPDKFPRTPICRRCGTDKILRVWLLHCHLEWHVEAGLTATLIEAPEELREHSPPVDHLRVCAAYGAPTRGNAAGNEGINLLGLDTEVTPGSTGALFPSGRDSDSSERDSDSSERDFDSSERDFDSSERDFDSSERDFDSSERDSDSPSERDSNSRPRASERAGTRANGGGRKGRETEY